MIRRFRIIKLIKFPGTRLYPAQQMFFFKLELRRILVVRRVRRRVGWERAAHWIIILTLAAEKRLIHRIGTDLATGGFNIRFI